MSESQRTPQQPLPKTSPFSGHTSGLSFAETRLRRLATEAMRNNPRRIDAAQDAFFASIRTDAGLLWELLSPWRVEIARRYMARAGAQEQAGVTSLPIVPPKPDADRQARARAAMGAVAGVHRRSWMQTIRIGGRPLSELTSRQAKRGAAKLAAHADFIERLTENLPPDEPIAKYRTEEYALKLTDELLTAVTRKNART